MAARRLPSLPLCAASSRLAADELRHLTVAFRLCASSAHPTHIRGSDLPALARLLCLEHIDRHNVGTRKRAENRDTHRNEAGATPTAKSHPRVKGASREVGDLLSRFGWSYSSLLGFDDVCRMLAPPTKTFLYSAAATAKTFTLLHDQTTDGVTFGSLSDGAAAVGSKLSQGAAWRIVDLGDANRDGVVDWTEFQSLLNLGERTSQGFAEGN
eukprot:GHVT01099118.1.p1 GENE.GHVT01099118.1~~GHVT01099118.1.p1  ORF type:complete len:212 (+),score=47.08 GHVT01099118.1:716-1351(+)